MNTHARNKFVKLLSETFIVLRKLNLKLVEFDCISNLLVSATFSRFNFESEFNAIDGTKLGYLFCRNEANDGSMVLHISTTGDISNINFDFSGKNCDNMCVIFQLNSLFDITLESYEAASFSITKLITFKSVWFLFSQSKIENFFSPNADLLFSLTRLLKKWNETFFLISAGCLLEPCFYCVSKTIKNRCGNCDLCKMPSDSLMLFDGKHTRRVTDEASNVMLICKHCFDPRQDALVKKE